MRYILHRGTVKSRVDGDIHHITEKDLIQLYGVNPKDCKEHDSNYRPREGDIHLFPRYDGRYVLPTGID